MCLLKPHIKRFFSEKSNNKWKIQISCGLSVKLPLAQTSNNDKSIVVNKIKYSVKHT